MKIFGIANITPDSFSDGGELPNIAQMLANGADVIDIGAESTRPGAKPVSVEEEIKRLTPYLKKPSSCGLISLDTRNPETAAHFAKQIHYLNDVSGFQNPKMLEIAAAHSLTAIAMHSLTVPADPQITIQGDAVEEILKWSEPTAIRLKAAGINKIILDPGLGFGKTREQNWQLIHSIAAITNHIHALGAEILVGHSRKSFLSQLPPEERDADTAKLTSSLLSAKVDYIRVHNIKLNKQAIGELPLHPHN